MTAAPLFGWLQSLYPLWTAAIDEEAEYLAAWVGLAELALSGCTTSTRPSLPASAPGRRPARGRDRGRDRPRHALPPDLRVDEPLGEGRRPPARRRGARRGRHPRRVRAPRRPLARPQSRRDGPDRLGALFAVHGHARPDAAHRRTGRTPRCSPPHPSRRERRGRRVRARHRSACGRSTSTRTSAGCRIGAGAPMSSGPNPEEVTRLGAAGVGRRPLPELQHDPVVGHRPGRRPAPGRLPGRSRMRRLVVGRLRLAVAGGPSGDAAGQARLRRRRR